MEKYRKAIRELVEKMQDERKLRKIYSFVLYLYIHEG